MLRGVMICSDEQIPPFRYLLNPNTLSWCDQPIATAAIYSAATALGPTRIGPAAKALLSSSRHMAHLKVTTTKALMRLLGEGDDQALSFLFKQWQNPRLHRDVRVVILQMALQLISIEKSPTLSADELLQTGAWDVLTDAAKNPAYHVSVRLVLLSVCQRSIRKNTEILNIFVSIPHRDE